MAQPGVFDQSLLEWSYKLYIILYSWVLLIIVNKNHGCKRQQRTMETSWAQCQSQQVIRSQPSAETVY